MSWSGHFSRSRTQAAESSLPPNHFPPFPRCTHPRWRRYKVEADRSVDPELHEFLEVMGSRKSMALALPGPACVFLQPLVQLRKASASGSYHLFVSVFPAQASAAGPTRALVALCRAPAIMTKGPRRQRRNHVPRQPCNKYRQSGQVARASRWCASTSPSRRTSRTKSTRN